MGIRTSGTTRNLARNQSIILKKPERVALFASFFLSADDVEDFLNAPFFPHPLLASSCVPCVGVVQSIVIRFAAGVAYCLVLKSAAGIKCKTCLYVVARIQAGLHIRVDQIL